MKQEEEDLFEGEVPIKFDDEEDEGPRGMAFQVITDPAYPGQFRVVRRLKLWLHRDHASMLTS
eukprot:30465-Eustigmatos_ZCMA.PRE.1